MSEEVAPRGRRRPPAVSVTTAAGDSHRPRPDRYLAEMPGGLRGQLAGHLPTSTPRARVYITSHITARHPSRYTPADYRLQSKLHWYVHAICARSRPELRLGRRTSPLYSSLFPAPADSFDIQLTNRNEQPLSSLSTITYTLT